MKHQRSFCRRGGARGARGQPYITSGQLTVHPHHSSSDEDYQYPSSSAPVKSEPEDFMFGNGQGSSSNNHRTNAFEDDNSMDQATIVALVRERIAEIEKDWPKLARTKAKIHLELDRHNPRSACYTRLLAQHQSTLQTVEDLKKRRDTFAEILADLMPAQEQQQQQQQQQLVVAGRSTVSNSSDTSDNIADRVLVLKPTMPKFGYRKGVTYTASPQDFLHRFEMYLRPFLGPERFERDCYRYMMVLTKDEHLQKDLFEQFELKDKASLTFEVCAQVFRQLTERGY
ncbi:hypothetical protein EC968_006800 [Mortierella alpina]|nr:hypothetical protein EC968_006800 [Mortierella alpina]